MTALYEAPLTYSQALRFLPRKLFSWGKLLIMFSYLSVLKTIIFLILSTFGQWMLSFVITPKVPYEPMNSCFKSYPVLSFGIYDLRSKISPPGSTASKPRIWDLNDPYLITYFPPALVEAFPPTWHEPLAPRSRGISNPFSSKNWFNFSRMTPASTEATELTGSNFYILFILFMLTMISSNIGTLPPTNPVFPPWGQMASLLSWQCLSIWETCWVFWGQSINLENPLTILKKQRLWSSSSFSSVTTSWGLRIVLKYYKSLYWTLLKSFLCSPSCQLFRYFPW